MPKLRDAKFSRVMRYEYVHSSISNSVLILKICQCVIELKYYTNNQFVDRSMY